MTKPVIVTESVLNGHLKSISTILNEQLEPSIKLQVQAETSQNPTIIRIVGSKCEYIERNRGAKVNVAPFLDLNNELWAWLGYHEEWQHEKPNKNVRRFSFRSSNITIYFGMKNDIFKPQVFRIEWAGLARWTGNDYSYQSENAGHPHWQIDAFDSAAKELNQNNSKILTDANIGVSEFTPLSTSDVNDEAVKKLSRIHFANAAYWWKSFPEDSHVHNPNSLGELQKWVKTSIHYILSELKKIT